MKQLRTAVVGLGRIGWKTHVKEVDGGEGFALAAVVDPDKTRLEEAHSVYGVSGYTSLEACLEAETPDLVVIASPTLFHASQTIVAFENGCDVFCDKPLAASLEEADGMIEAMEKHGRKLMVYQPLRCGPDVVALQDILGRGIIGPPYLMKTSRLDYVRRNDWQTFRKNGGGMLNNYGAHAIDQALYLCGSRARAISGYLRSVACLGDADDVVKAVIETDNGVIVDIDINMAFAQKEDAWHVVGPHGSATLDYANQSWRVRFFNPEELAERTTQEGLSAEGRQYVIEDTIPWQEADFPLSEYDPVDFYQRCYEYFACDKDPFVPIAETREVMRVLDECRRDDAT
jgi:scyllo-inositol 2-dehydrogenase (NADP+)